MQAIYAEGKQHALAIGYTKMSAQDMYAVILPPYVYGVTFVCWSCTIFRSKFILELEVILSWEQKMNMTIICLMGRSSNVAERASIKESEWTTCTTLTTGSGRYLVCVWVCVSTRSFCFCIHFSFLLPNVCIFFGTAQANARLVI